MAEKEKAKTADIPLRAAALVDLEEPVPELASQLAPEKKVESEPQKPAPKVEPVPPPLAPKPMQPTPVPQSIQPKPISQPKKPDPIIPPSPKPLAPEIAPVSLPSKSSILPPLPKLFTRPLQTIASTPKTVPALKPLNAKTTPPPSSLPVKPEAQPPVSAPTKPPVEMVMPKTPIASAKPSSSNPSPVIPPPQGTSSAFATHETNQNGPVIFKKPPSPIGMAQTKPSQPPQKPAEKPSVLQKIGAGAAFAKSAIFDPKHPFSREEVLLPQKNSGPSILSASRVNAAEVLAQAQQALTKVKSNEPKIPTPPPKPIEPQTGERPPLSKPSASTTFTPPQPAPSKPPVTTLPTKLPVPIPSSAPAGTTLPPKSPVPIMNAKPSATTSGPLGAQIPKPIPTAPIAAAEAPKPPVTTLPPKPPIQAAPQPPVIKKDMAAQVVRTFKSDIENRVQTANVSLVSIAAAQAENGNGSPELFPEKKSFINTKKLLKIAEWGGGVLLILAAFGVLGFTVYSRYTPQGPTPAGTIEAPFINVDQTQPIAIPPNTSSFLIMQGLAQFRETTSMPLGLVGQIYLIESTTTNITSDAKEIPTDELFRLVAPQAPQELVRSLDPEYLLALHSFDGNQPFIMFKTNSYEQAFAGMLSWESTMPQTLGILFNRGGAVQANDSASSTNPAAFASDLFSDEVIQNHDARVLRNQKGDISLLWTFLDRSTLVITTNEATLREIISRLTQAPTVPAIGQ